LAAPEFDILANSDGDNFEGFNPAFSNSDFLLTVNFFPQALKHLNRFLTETFVCLISSVVAQHNRHVSNLHLDFSTLLLKLSSQYP